MKNEKGGGGRKKEQFCPQIQKLSMAYLSKEGWLLQGV